MKTKNILKKILFKFISNTQMKEINNLQQAFTSVANDKRELEVKNKKYQEFLNTVLKEKEEKDSKITEISRELEKTKKKLIEKEKKVLESDRKIRDLESRIKEQRIVDMHKTVHNNNLRTMSNRRRIFYDDTELRTSTRKILNDKNNHNKINSNYVNIDLSSKVPIVTAFLHGGNLYSNNSLNSPSISNPIINLKNNLNKKSSIRSISKSPKKIESDKLIDNQINFKRDLVINKSKNNLSRFLNNKVISASLSKLQKNKKEQKEKELLIKDLNIKDGEIIKHITAKNILASSNNIKTIKSGSSLKSQIYNQINIPNSVSSKFNLPPNDSISISAVTYNNEICQNSSELDIMENVLILDGINSSSKNLTPMGRNSEKKITFFNSNIFKEIPEDVLKTFYKSKSLVTKSRHATPINKRKSGEDNNIIIDPNEEKVQIDNNKNTSNNRENNLPVEIYIINKKRVEINLENSFNENDN